MKVLLFFILLVLTLKVSLAIDTLTFENCENLGIKDCDGFKQLNVTVDKQKELFSSLLGIKDKENIHDFIFDWNTNLVFSEIPYTVLPENCKTIEDAWLIVSSIMPSVLYGNALYNNYSGFLQINYGYELTRPGTYFNGHWSVCGSGSTNELGDCRTEYPKNWDLSYLDVYLNNRHIGNATLVKFNTTDALNNFESVLNIANKIQREHYKWQQGDCCKCKHCCWRSGETRRCGRSCSRCGCEDYWQNCQSAHTDFRFDNLVLTHSKTSLLEQISYSKPIILFDKAKSMAYFIINTTNIDHYNLNVDEFKLTKNNLAYSYEYDYLPVNVLIAKADDNPEINAHVYSTLTNQSNSDLISFYLRKKESYDCKLDLYSYFNSFNLSCNVTILPPTELNITTDKFFYMPNETIKVNISIKSNTNNDIIKVRYGNYSIDILGSKIIEIPTQLNVNQIKAEYETDLTHQSASAVKTISVYAGEKPSYYITIFWIIIAFLCFISVLRMCWIKVFGVENA